MNKITSLATGAFIALLVAAGCKPASGGLGSATSITEKPEDAVKGFVAAINAKDDNAAQSFVYADGSASLADLLKVMPITVEAADYKATMKEPYLAEVSFNLTTNSDAPGASGMTGTGPDHVSLVAVGGKWKILPSMVSFPGTSRLSLGSFAAMMGMTQMFARAKTAAQATSSLSNAKQIATATMIYCGDSDDVYPLATNTIDGIMPYIKNHDLLTAPGDPKGSISYSFNDAILGKSAVSVVSPATTVMLYEGKDHKLNFAHDGKAAVAFCDGHAKLFTAAEAATLNWDPKK